MLTLVTINYNGSDDTIGLLRSLESQTSKNFSVIVVDNDSTPQQREQLGQYAASSPLTLDVIYSDINRGFSGGNNLGIRKALAQKSEWVLLINNDTTVQSDFIASLPLDRPGLVGLPIKEGERVAYSGQVHWLMATLPHNYIPTPRFIHSYAIGAGMLIHQSVFEKTGFLDERYFLYFEDADFSMRAERLGAPVFFAQQPIISHRPSSTTKQLGGPLLLRYHHRNSLLFNRANGPWWVIGALPVLAISRILFQAVKYVLMPSRRIYARAITTGIIDYYANRFGNINAYRHRD